MLQQLGKLKVNALQELEGINNVKELESWRVHYLGRKSHLTKVLRSLATLPLEEKKAVGARANEIKSFLEDSLRQKEQALRELELAASAGGEHIDITLPGHHLPIGRLHPITQTLNEILSLIHI